MNRWLIAVVLLVASCAPHVPPATSTSSATIDGDAISERSIRAHMEFLAGDALNGRGSGTRDEWIAASYVASQFRLWGLEPMGDAGGFVQTVEMAYTEAAAATLTAGTLRLIHGRQMLVTVLGSPVEVSGPLHKLEAGTPVPAGSVVLVTSGPLPNPAVVGQAAVVLISETPQVRARWDATAVRPLRVTQPRAVRLAPLPQIAPVSRPTRIVLGDEARAAIEALPNGTTVTFSAEVRKGQSYTWNAIGRLTGTDAAAGRDVVVLSAHLDHLGAQPLQPGVDTINNGADDDASGTVAVMALAEALANGPRPKRTIVFALFGSEEAGGFGAGLFVDLPVIPLDRLVTDLQFEMLGRPDPAVPADHLWLTGYERSNLGAELAKQGARLVADPHPAQNFFTRSDNIRFARRGVVAHTVSSFNLHREYHTVEDELALIDFPYMTAAIRSLIQPIRWLANSGFTPAWNPGGCPAPCQ